MAPTAYAQYRKVTAETASPGDLLLQLYQAAIRNLGQAGEAVDHPDVARAHAHIMRAQDILSALQATLDFERGGDIAPQLDRLYTYMRKQLMTANIHKDRPPLDEVAGLLRQLLASWEIAVRETNRRAQLASPGLATVAARQI